MTVQAELTRLASLDLGKAKESLSASRESISAVSGGLNSLCGTNEDVTRAINTVCGALQIMTGLASVGKVAKAVTEARTDAKAVQAGALTSALALMGPPGWARIALAGTAMATASAVMYATVNTVRLGKFDLSTSSGQSNAVLKTAEAMA